MGATKQRVVVVSNRGPLRSERSGAQRRWVRSAGGLVAALDPVLRSRGGVWVSAQEAEAYLDVPVSSPELGYETHDVHIPRSVAGPFYRGVSNAVLWPLLHSFPPTARVGEAPFSAYVKANRAFVDATLDASVPRDLLWIHDYHLMLLPRMVRQKRRRARIGWFCHVPWPNPDLFEIFPWREPVLEGLLGADLLAFHTEIYVRNFLECIERLTRFHVDHTRRIVHHEGWSTRVIAAPIGVPVRELEQVSADPEVVAHADDLKKLVGGRRIVLGVDRMDYSKGIPERILAWERFLASNSRARRDSVLVHVTVPSRPDVEGYAQLKGEIDRLVGHTNGRFGVAGTAPIHYLFRNLSQRDLFAHYRAADVALVTPLRDGMNLVAQEYVASRVDDSGALVLSEFAGAAEYLSGATVVNPYDIDAIAEAIGTALALDRRETKKRMRAMRREVALLDVHRWADSFLTALETV